MYALSDRLAEALALYQKSFSSYKESKLQQSLVQPVEKILTIISTPVTRKRSGLGELRDQFRAQNWIHFSPFADVVGRFLVDSGKFDVVEVEEWIRRTIEMNQQVGFRLYLGYNHSFYAQFFKSQNNPLKAREQMNKAIDIMKECGADGWVERYEKELAEMN